MIIFFAFVEFGAPDVELRLAVSNFIMIVVDTVSLVKTLTVHINSFLCICFNRIRR